MKRPSSAAIHGSAMNATTTASTTRPASERRHRFGFHIEVRLVDDTRPKNRGAQSRCKHRRTTGDATGETVEHDSEHGERDERGREVREHDRTTHATGKAAIGDVIQLVRRYTRVRDENRARVQRVQDPNDDHFDWQARMRSRTSRRRPRIDHVPIVTEAGFG